MGLRSRLPGNASGSGVADVQEHLEELLAEGEEVQQALATYCT
jgi:hypothetical protein